MVLGRNSGKEERSVRNISVVVALVHVSKEDPVVEEGSWGGCGHAFFSIE
jgi:hypothetical protein